MLRFLWYNDNARVMSRTQTNPSRTKPGWSDVVPYETRLSQDRRWALTEASEFFQGKGGIQASLRRIARRLDQIGVPYAVVGGLALFQHGFRRFTEDIDILVRREGLKAIHDNLEGLGYVRPFAGSKHLKDTESGTRIEFLIAGEYPGDGKPKSVAFPDPDDAAVMIDGIRYINLPKLVELKLASGMTGATRMQDITDVFRLIAVLNLPQQFRDQLDPFVREKYDELWQAAQTASDSEREP